jgi:DNA polymerase
VTGAPAPSRAAGRAEDHAANIAQLRSRIAPVAAAPPSAIVPDDGTAAAKLETFRREICDCTRCKLAETRNMFVFGSGNPRAQVMFIGEAPGFEEDMQGQPFVGRAGQLLTKVVESLPLPREQVYIANIIKCRPPGNRKPGKDEIETCRGYLFRQIELIEPKWIVLLGATAVEGVLDRSEPMGRMRGQTLEYRGIPVTATYHPSYLLRSPKEKGKVWEDLAPVREWLRTGA